MRNFLALAIGRLNEGAALQYVPLFSKPPRSMELDLTPFVRPFLVNYSHCVANVVVHRAHHRHRDHIVDADSRGTQLKSLIEFLQSEVILKLLVD